MRSRKSVKIGLVFLPTIALFMACSGDNAADRRCVDADSRVVSQELCDNAQRSNVGGMYASPYLWYYGGYGGRGMGSVVSGGNSVAPSSVAGSSGSVGRGGLGATAAGASSSVGS
ncbi:MAG: hypothetical protein EXR50_04470 [Dehalococcoidia bacterium]|nr:hypothetical protein [Dehalococcoidia bacterium]